MQRFGPRQRKKRNLCGPKTAQHQRKTWKGSQETETRTVLCVGRCRFSRLCPVWPAQPRSSPSSSVLWVTNGIHDPQRKAKEPPGPRWFRKTNERAKGQSCGTPAACLRDSSCRCRWSKPRGFVPDKWIYTPESPETDSHMTGQGLRAEAWSFCLTKTAFWFRVLKRWDIHLHKKKSIDPFLAPHAHTNS